MMGIQFTRCAVILSTNYLPRPVVITLPGAQGRFYTFFKLQRQNERDLQNISYAATEYLEKTNMNINLNIFI